MKTIKRMAALLLVVVLVLSCLPAASVFAAELPEETVPPTTEAADPPTVTEPSVTEETQPLEDPPGPTATTEPKAPEAPSVPPEDTPPENGDPTEDTNEPTEESSETSDGPGEENPKDSAPAEPVELYRTSTEEGNLTAAIHGFLEENPASSDFQVVRTEVTEGLADELAIALYDYTGSSYAPLSAVAIQSGFGTGGIHGKFTLELTFPGSWMSLEGSVFVFQSTSDGVKVLPTALVTQDSETAEITVSIPLNELTWEKGKFIIANAEPIMVEGGSSGSTIGPGAGIGGGVPHGKGSNLGISVGVTMQVVYYKYKDCWNRNNSYECVRDTLLNISGNPHPALDDDGTVLSNTVLDGFTWVQRNTFWASGAGQRINSYQGPNYVSNAGSDVWNYIERIIFGSSYGAWDKKSVGDTSSLYTKVLRLLGTPESMIQNYLDSFNDRLTVETDGETLIPTIIWAWYGSETISGIGNIEALSGSILSVCNGNPSGDQSSKFLKKAYYSPAALTSTSPENLNCYWCTYDSDSVTCRLLLGEHKCHGPGVTIYDKTCYGTGFVNRINANGVDANSGPYYYFRGYWTPYGEVEEVQEQPVTIQKSINASPECIAQLMDNAMYSLEGAKYDVVIDGEVVETLITDANGNTTTTKKFKPGTTGTVVETQAPPGFRLDSTPVPFTIPTSGKCIVKVSDVPIMDPPFAITKVDKDTTTAQGDSSFSGAVFRFEYFDNTDWSGTAKRTWYFQTDKDGWARYSLACVAPGYTSDELYVDSYDIPSVPLCPLPWLLIPLPSRTLWKPSSRQTVVLPWI